VRFPWDRWRPRRLVRRNRRNAGLFGSSKAGPSAQCLDHASEDAGGPGEDALQQCRGRWRCLRAPWHGRRALRQQRSAIGHEHEAMRHERCAMGQQRKGTWHERRATGHRARALWHCVAAMRLALLALWLALCAQWLALHALRREPTGIGHGARATKHDRRGHAPRWCHLCTAPWECCTTSRGRRRPLRAAGEDRGGVPGPRPPSRSRPPALRRPPPDRPRDRARPPRRGETRNTLSLRARHGITVPARPGGGVLSREAGEDRGGGAFKVD
jgi:hypothetical protein